MYPANLLNPNPASGAMATSPQPVPDSNMRMGTPAPAGYAHGGHTRRGKMIMAHMNPHELNVLDHLQGKTEKCPRSGMRSYSHLEELLKNPHILSSVHQHARNHKMAMGGHMNGGHMNGGGDPRVNALASQGRMGDSEMALIGPHTHNLFNYLAGGHTKNPSTGYPEYWSIGDALGGLWNGIKGVGSSLWNGVKSVASPVANVLGSVGKAVLPGVMPAIEGAATDALGPLGGMASGLLGNAASSGLDALSGMGSGGGGEGDASQQGAQGPQAQAQAPQASGLGSTLGEAARSGLQSYMSGQSPYQAMGSAMNQMGNRFSGGLGSAMRGMGSSMNQGYGMGHAMNQGFQGMGGMSGLGNMAQQAYGNYSGGMSPMQSMYHMGNSYMQNAMPTQQSMENQNNFQEMPFGGDYEYGQ